MLGGVRTPEQTARTWPKTWLPGVQRLRMWAVRDIDGVS
jgi:hypothetical protein